MQIVLASSSPRRKDLMEETGIPFMIDVANVEEYSQQSHPHLDPTEISLENARIKANTVAERHPQGLIVAADTIVVIDHHILGKPVNHQDAVRMLTMLSGKTHQVYTAMVLKNNQDLSQKEIVEVTEVTFLPLNQSQIERYLSIVDVMDKAGSYAYQTSRELIIEKIKGLETTVIGLPVEHVIKWWDELNKQN
jgi:septum formation protein